MGVKKMVDSTVAERKVLMLFALFYVYSWREVTMASAASVCNKNECIQTCFEDDCQNVCHSQVVQCMQKGYGYAKRSVLSCQAWKLCAQMCSDGECVLSCDQSKKCTQECYGKLCTAACNDGNNFCEQQCFFGNCSMKCNTPKCNQECHVNDCTASCVHGVEECTQVCHVDKCHFSCFAKKCNVIYMTGEKKTRSSTDKVMFIATTIPGAVVMLLIILIVTLLVKYRRRKQRDTEGPLVDQQEPVYEDVENEGEARLDNEGSFPSNTHGNFEHTWQRNEADNEGYSIPFGENNEYAIPNSDMEDLSATRPYQNCDECKTCQHSGSAMQDEKNSKKEDNTDDERLEHIVADLTEAPFKAMGHNESNPLQQSFDLDLGNVALQGSKKDENNNRDPIPPALDEPQIKASRGEPSLSAQNPNKEDPCSDGEPGNNDRSDDIVLGSISSSSGQKVDKEGESEAREAAKTSTENLSWQLDDDPLEDSSTTEDIMLVYIEPISDKPGACSQGKTNEDFRAPATRFEGESNSAGSAQGKNTTTDFTSDGASQANGEEELYKVVKGEGGECDYQALDQKKQEIEEKSRYQKLMKRKTA